MGLDVIADDDTSGSPVESRAVIERLTALVEPAAVRVLMAQALAGEISTPIALMRMLLATEDGAVVRLAVDEVTRRADLVSRADDDGLVRDRVDDLTQLVVDHEDGLDRIVDMLRTGPDSSRAAPTVEEGLAFCEQLFDWSAARSEEASVALYSLGSPALLARATAEIVELFEQWAVLGKDRRVLQIGCGIGRIEQAIAGLVREAHGVDVSAEMIHRAQRRCAGLDNVFLRKTAGRDLADFGDASFDLVYAVDSFPYLVQSGEALVARHFAEARRVLRPGGRFAILNYSYRGDAEGDRADVRRLAQEHDFEIKIDGEQPFTLWDGTVWLLQ